MPCQQRAAHWPHGHMDVRLQRLPGHCVCLDVHTNACGWGGDGVRRWVRPRDGSGVGLLALAHSILGRESSGNLTLLASNLTPLASRWSCCPSRLCSRGLPCAAHFLHVHEFHLGSCLSKQMQRQLRLALTIAAQLLLVAACPVWSGLL